MSSFLKALPTAATNPLALVAYLAAIAAWTYLGSRVRRLRVLLQSIQLIPEADRSNLLRDEMGVVNVPLGMTADQYLRARLQTLLFAGFSIACGCVLIIVAIAYWDGGSITATLDGPNG
jgi:hypothetical protein